jgi:hypothetical protein
MNRDYCTLCLSLDDDVADCDNCEGTGYEPVEESERVKAANKLLEAIRKNGILGGGF